MTAIDCKSVRISYIFVNSGCATDNDEREYLMKLLGNKRIVTLLLYSGSVHGWKAKHFHSRCDKRSPTISLFKIKNGDCIGGYTNALWTSEGKLISDNQAMLFNLSRGRYFNNKKTGKEIVCNKDIGPYFGNLELSAYPQPFNGEGNCVSQANNSSYEIQV